MKMEGKIKKQILFVPALALLLLAVVVPNAIAYQVAKPDFLFILSSDDGNKVTRCFQFAEIAHAKGYKVNIFMIDDGVIWAVPGKTKGVVAKTGDAADNYLPYLIKNKVPISV